MITPQRGRGDAHLGRKAVSDKLPCRDIGHVQAHDSCVGPCGVVRAPDGYSAAAGLGDVATWPWTPLKREGEYCGVHRWRGEGSPRGGICAQGKHRARLGPTDGTCNVQHSLASLCPSTRVTITPQSSSPLRLIGLNLLQPESEGPPWWPVPLPVSL